MNKTPQSSPDSAASSRYRPAPLWRRAARLGVHVFFASIARIWFRVEAENVPRIIPGKPIILAPNHVSYLDPPVLQHAVWTHVTFMMTEVIYKRWFLGWMFRIWSAIPIPEDRPPTAAMKAALRALRAGQSVAIFPEGKISLDGYLNEGHGGVGMLIVKGRVPVIPVAILGTFEVLPKHRWWPRRHRVLVRFGEPIDPGSLGKDDVPAFVERLMGEIEKLGAPRRPE